MFFFARTAIEKEVVLSEIQMLKEKVTVPSNRVMGLKSNSLHFLPRPKPQVS